MSIRDVSTRVMSYGYEDAMHDAAVRGESFLRINRAPISGEKTFEWLDPRTVSCNPDGSFTVNRGSE